MRWLGDRWCIEGRLLQRKEPLGQAIKLGSRLLDDLPLLCQLVRQFLDHLCLMGGKFFQPHHAVVVIGHVGAFFVRPLTESERYSSFLRL